MVYLFSSAYPLIKSSVHPVLSLDLTADPDISKNVNYEIWQLLRAKINSIIISGELYMGKQWSRFPKTLRFQLT